MKQKNILIFQIVALFSAVFFFYPNGLAAQKIPPHSGSLQGEVLSAAQEQENGGPAPRTGTEILQPGAASGDEAAVSILGKEGKSDFTGTVITDVETALKPESASASKVGADSLETIKKRIRPPGGQTYKNTGIFFGQIDFDANPEMVLKLGVAEFIQRVKEQNQKVTIQRLEWLISKEAVKNAESIFEPLVVSSMNAQRNNEKRSIEDRTSNFANVQETNRKEDKKHFDAALESLLPTGAEMRLGYNLEVVDNIFTQPEKEYYTFVGTNLKQPLLKGFGPKNTKANIFISEADSEIAFQTFRQQLMDIVANAARTYWDLSLIQEIYRIRQESVEIAEHLHRDAIERYQAGKIPETEILQARAGLSQRRALVSQAKQQWITAMNNAWTFIAASPAEGAAFIEAVEPRSIRKPSPDPEVSLAKAFRLRPEYLSALRKIKREEIRISYARNQRWPQLDLNASYGLNGLEYELGTSANDAFSLDNETWLLGFEFRIPLTGGQKSRSELAAARHRKRQALMELKSVEIALLNSVDAAVKSVYQTIEQVAHVQQARFLNQEILEAELARFNAGKSNSYLVLNKEEDLNSAKESELQSLINYQKALITLDLIKGTLLQRFGVEIKPEEVSS